MIEYAVLDKLLSRIRHGGLEVTYWNGRRRTYGPDPNLRLGIHSPDAVRRLLHGTLGLGEAYMDGIIDVEPIDRLLQLQADNPQLFARFGWAGRLRGHPRNTRATQPRQVRHHYDLGNDFFALFLDKSMTYSCGYFEQPGDSLEQAQTQKLDHTLRKLQLQPDMSLLDIGCGWGSLAIRAAQRHNVQVLGITLSQNQADEATARARAAGVGRSVSFETVGYQELAESGILFDRIVSVGMFEHVGRANHAGFFDAVEQMLMPGGLAVLHTITHETEQPANRWITRYIFPGGYIPSKREVVWQLPRRDLRLLDYEDLRLHYALTLDEWLRRYEANVDAVRAMFDERFVRMWRFYLGVSSGSFRYGGSSLSQFVFSLGPNNRLPLTRRHLYESPAPVTAG